ncbi:MAG: ABC transporter ATP-binding protein [Chloroflexi bacterium]|nr:ABC transporter ATP-binding protein [Chloroflexota bacterium]
MTAPLLEVRGLTLEYLTSQGRVSALDDVSFTLERGESLGLVGESGSGKTSIAISLLNLLPDNARILSGSVRLDGVELLTLDESRIRAYRGNKIALIFQAAMSSLNPVYRVGDQIVEPMTLHLGLTPAQAKRRVGELFELVGLDPDQASRYPHELSGGMRQRVVIAMALSCDPDVIVADEPTTGLDAIIQDQILRNLKEVQRRDDIGMLYITHDMAVIAEVADRVGVMYGGKLVEIGDVESVLNAPAHPYTAALTSSIPSVRGELKELTPLEGAPPDPTNLPNGCRFHPRCSYATEECRSREPAAVIEEGRSVACWHPLAAATKGAPVPARSDPHDQTGR